MPAILLAALPALTAAPIVVNESGTSVVLSGVVQTEDVASGGIGGFPATGNALELQTTGTLSGNVTGNPEIAGSGFDRIKMNGDLWRFSGTADLIGTSASTFHVATGTFMLAGAVNTGSAAPGDATVTIGAGATLHFTESGSISTTSIINDGRIYISRASTTRLGSNISGSGMLELENVVYLTGTNTHTGGILISTGDTYADAPTALGSGTVNILVGTCDLFLSSTIQSDFHFNNPLAGEGRMIVKLLPSGTHVFSFGSAVGSDFAGTFIAQVGSYKFDANSDLALANAALISVDRDSTVYVSTGSHHYKKMQFSNNAAAEITKHWAATMSFEGNFSATSAPTLASIYLDDSLSVGATSNITMHTTVPAVAPSFTIVTPSAANLLLMDEQVAATTTWTGTLLSLAPGKTIANHANLIHQPLDNTALAGATTRIAYQEGGSTVGNLIYNYYTSANANGIYLNYGFAALEVLGGKTLTLNGDVTTGGGNDFKLRITGSGDLKIAATRSILFSNPNGDFIGNTTITSGTLIMSGTLGKGTVTVNPGTTLQIGNGAATGYAGMDIVNNGTLRINPGSNTFEVSSNISGTSKLTLNVGTNILSGTNTFSGGLDISSNTNHEAASTKALGTGTVTIGNGYSFWLKPSTPGNQVWTNPWNGGVGVAGGRLIVRMNTGTDVFSFQNGSAVATTGTGTRIDGFIMQDGVLLLDSEAVAALAGRQIRVDYGSTIRVAPGDQSFKRIAFSNNNSGGGKVLTLSFDADFSNPAAPNLGHLILDGIDITIASMNVRFDSSTPLGSLPTPAAPGGANPLTMDDDAGNIVYSGTLLSFAGGAAPLTSDFLNRLALDQQVYVNGTASDTLSVGGDFSQNGAAVGKLLYGYNLSSDSKGIYLNAGLAGLEVLEGKTLLLSGDSTDTEGANEFRLRLTGSGNIDVNATNAIIISNRSNTISGLTSINSGTLVLTGKLPGNVTINPGTTLQIGAGSALGEVGGNILHDGTLIYRRTSGTLASNISGSGQVVLDYGTNIGISGSNTHTGGVTFVGSDAAANYYVNSGYALGSGTMTAVTGKGQLSIWMKPSKAGDIALGNAIVMTSTVARMIVFMKNATDKFTFENAEETTYLGSFIGQRGTYELSGDTAAVLANAKQVRFDKGSTVYIDSSGTAIIRDLYFTTNPSGSTEDGYKDPYSKLVFDADFTDASKPAILSNLYVTERLNFSSPVSIQLNHTGAIPIPEFDVTTSGSNLLGLDNEINAHSISIKLISTAPDAVVGGAANYLANMTLLDAAGDRINAAHSIDLNQNGEKIGSAYANYYAAQKTDGIYMNYGLAEVTINEGKTLVLSGDTAQDNEFTAKLSGAGNVDIRATKAIKLSTYYGSSALTGTMTLHTGTLIMGTPGVLSSVGRLELKPGTAMDLNDADQSINSLLIPENASVNVHYSQFTIGASGTLNGKLHGTGGIIAAANATLDVRGNNPDLDINWTVNSGAKLNMHSPDAAGIGRITVNAGGQLNMDNVPGGTLDAEIAGNGVAAINSSTLAMNKAVTVGTLNINSSDVTLRHTNGLAAASLAEAHNSTIRIDTSSHVQAKLLRLTDSAIVFVPQSNGTYGNLMVDSLETGGGNPTLIKMNVDLTKAGAGDSLIVRDNITGQYVLEFNNVAPGNKADNSVALRVVRTPTPAGLANFTLKGGYLEAGVYTYELVQGDASNAGFLMDDPASYYLVAAGANPLTRTAQALLSTAAIAGAEWNYSLDSLSKRMGDLRREIDTLGKDRFYETWGRANSYKLRADKNIGGAAFEEEVYNFSFGADVGRRLASGRGTIILGLYGDVGYVNRDFENRSTGATNSYAAGLYATWLSLGGWYADFAFKADTQDNKFDVLCYDSSRAHGNYSGKSTSLSIELGRKIKLGRTWWLEPGLQLATANFAKRNYTTDTGIDVAVAENKASQYRAQIRFGRDNIGGRLQPYGRIAYARCNGDALDIVADGRALADNLSFDDTRYEFGVGGSFLFTKQDQLYMEYEYSKANHYNRPWAINVGFRHLW